MTSNDEGDGVSASDPIDTTVSIPAGSISNDTTVTITEVPASAPGVPPAPGGFEVLGQVVVVDTNPPATFSAENPAALTITYDQSVAPADELAIQVMRFDGAAWVPAGESCAGGTAGTRLAPDPCVSARDTTANTITVQTTAFSDWALMAPPPVPVAPTSIPVPPAATAPQEAPAAPPASLPDTGTGGPAQGETNWLLIGVLAAAGTSLAGVGLAVRRRLGK